MMPRTAIAQIAKMIGREVVFAHELEKTRTLPRTESGSVMSAGPISSDLSHEKSIALNRCAARLAGR